MHENNILRKELEDTKITLEINKSIIYKQLSNSLTKDKKYILESLQKEVKRLSDNNNNLYSEKLNFEKKWYKTKDTFENSIIKMRELYDKKESEIFILENKVKEKDNIINSLKKEIEKYRNENDKFSKEIFIIDPDKVNIEINNEVYESRELLNKYSKMLADEKKYSNELEFKIKQLNYKLDGKIKKSEIEDKFENIKLFDYILTDSESGEDDFEDNESNNTDGDVYLESPYLNLPQKTKQKYLLTEIAEKNNGIVPKLNFTKVKKKYQPLKLIEVVDIEKNSNKSSDEYIDKLKFQIKFDRNEIKRLKKKNKELRKIIEILKHHYLTLKNSLNPLSTKDGSKDNKKTKTNEQSNALYDKKKNKITPKSDRKKKISIIDESMEQNYSLIPGEKEIEEEITFDDLDFKAIIKEYNAINEGNIILNK